MKGIGHFCVLWALQSSKNPAWLAKRDIPDKLEKPAKFAWRAFMFK
jgi:hypothetical protein